MRALPLSLAAFASLLGLSLVAAACGTSSGSGGSEFGDKCQLVCAPPPGPCEAQDPTDCLVACATALDGMTVGCAQCVVESSAWSGGTCSCSGGDCHQASFGPGVNEGGSGPGICDPASDTHCSGFTLAKTSGTECKTACTTS